MGRSVRRLFMGVLISLVLMGFSYPGRAQETKAPSSQSLQGLVDLMENPEKREAFLKDLKTLIETKKTLEKKNGKETAGTEQSGKKQLAIVRFAFEQFENLSGISKAVLRQPSILPIGYP